MTWRTDCEAINKPNRVRSGAFRARLAARFGCLGGQVPDSVRIFLSTVSDEFRDYRDQLRGDLTRHNVEVKIQEDFQDLGIVTLDKLDVYIKACDAVIHLVGDMTGADARPLSTKAILERYPDLPKKLPPLGDALVKGDSISYTQWEAWLALYHNKVLLIAKADDKAPRGPAYAPTDASRAAQQAHLVRLRAVESYPGKKPFTSPDNLAKQIALGAILDLLKKAPSSLKPRNLPFASLGPLFKGRGEFLDRLRDSLARTQDGHAAAVIGKALHGLGGIGKTRAAIEYAWHHVQDYTALLFVPAATPERLAAGLTALAGPDILDLPEKDAREDTVKIPAALNWLDAHPGWLMILDNVDDEKAAAAVEDLVARFKGGHVLITGRTGDFSAAIETLFLDVLTENDAASLLLDSTKKREKAPNDGVMAHELARELGGLALALAQAGAYIDRQRTSIARYLKLWREKRETVLGWFDKRLVSYNHDVGLATTWTASVEKLTPSGRRLLELCAFVGFAPIPKFLLDVPAPSSFDAHEALADLFAYSLASPITADGRAREPGFAIHRLVQEFTRQKLEEAKRNQVLEEALGWVNAGFVGNPEDAQRWPVLDPLAPHALAVAKHADEYDISEPTARLMNQLGMLIYAKSKGEPKYWRALAIGEDALLPARYRLAEAEPLMRRALAITETSLGPDHAKVATSLNNLALLLEATNRHREAEPLMRRALAIDEANFGPDHPEVAISLNNLAKLLQATNRLAEAEPLMQRHVEIFRSFRVRTGHEHPRSFASFVNYFDLLSTMGRSKAEAIEALIRAHGQMK